MCVVQYLGLPIVEYLKIFGMPGNCFWDTTVGIYYLRHFLPWIMTENYSKFKINLQKNYPASCSIIALRTYSKRLRFGQEALFLSVKTSGSDRLWDTWWCNKHLYLLANVIVLIIFYYNSGLQLGPVRADQLYAALQPLRQGSNIAK